MSFIKITTMHPGGREVTGITQQANVTAQEAFARRAVRAGVARQAARHRQVDAHHPPPPDRSCRLRTVARVCRDHRGIRRHPAWTIRGEAMTELIVDIPDNSGCPPTIACTGDQNGNARSRYAPAGCSWPGRRSSSSPPLASSSSLSDSALPARLHVDNSAPTVKCLVDGIVQARAIEDDNSDHIVRTIYERGPRVKEKGWRRIHLKFIDQSVPF